MMQRRFRFGNVEGRQCVEHLIWKPAHCQQESHQGTHARKLFTSASKSYVLFSWGVFEDVRDMKEGKPGNRCWYKECECGVTWYENFLWICYVTPGTSQGRFVQMSFNWFRAIGYGAYKPN